MDTQSKNILTYYFFILLGFIGFTYFFLRFIEKKADAPVAKARVFSSLNLFAYLSLLFGVYYLYLAEIWFDLLTGNRFAAINQKIESLRFEEPIGAFFLHHLQLIMVLGTAVYGLMGMMFAISGIGILIRREWGRATFLGAGWVYFIYMIVRFVYFQSSGFMNILLGRVSFLQWVFDIFFGLIGLYLIFKSICYFSIDNVKGQFLKSKSKMEIHITHSST